MTDAPEGKFPPGLLSFTLVFSPGRHTAPDMPFLLVFVKHMANLCIEQGVAAGQMGLQILMYR